MSYRFKCASLRGLRLEAFIKEESACNAVPTGSLLQTGPVSVENIDSFLIAVIKLNLA